jgi:RNA polymerase sigma-70 factor (ECF subfamily)
MSALVRAAQDGDGHAFQVLFRALQPGLLRYLYVLVGDEAEDVASEAWLQITRDLESFQGDADGFRGWVATVGRNRALDHLRGERRRPRVSVPVEYLTELPGQDDTAKAALSGVANGTALGLIAQLPRDQAEAVLLRVVMDLDANSAAQVLGKRPGAVRMAAHRGLRRLAKLLEQSATAPEPAGAAAVPEERASPSPPKSAHRGVTRKKAPTRKDTR